MNRSTFLRRAFGAAIAVPALTAIIAKGTSQTNTRATVSFEDSKEIVVKNNPKIVLEPSLVKGDKVVYLGGVNAWNLVEGEIYTITNSLINAVYKNGKTQLREYIWINDFKLKENRNPNDSLGGFMGVKDIKGWGLSVEYFRKVS